MVLSYKKGYNKFCTQLNLYQTTGIITAATKLYIHTDEQGRMRGPNAEFLSPRWGIGFSHSRKGGFPAYTDKVLAELFDPAFSQYAYNLWEAETEDEIHMDSLGIRAHARELRTIKEVRTSVPIIQCVRFAMLCAMEVYNDDEWRAHAKMWLAGDHTAMKKELLPGDIRKNVVQPEAVLATEAVKFYNELEHSDETKHLLVEAARKAYSNSPKDMIEIAVGREQYTAAVSDSYNATRITLLSAQAAVRSAESAKYLGKKLDFAGLAALSRT